MAGLNVGRAGLIEVRALGVTHLDFTGPHQFLSRLPGIGKKSAQRVAFHAAFGPTRRGCGAG